MSFPLRLPYEKSSKPVFFLIQPEAQADSFYKSPGLSQFFNTTASHNLLFQSNVQRRKTLQKIVSEILRPNVVKGRAVLVLIGDGEFGHSRGYAPMPHKALADAFAERVPVIYVDEYLTSQVRTPTPFVCTAWELFNNKYMHIFRFALYASPSMA
jgi:hypothetical protein